MHPVSRHSTLHLHAFMCSQHVRSASSVQITNLPALEVEGCGTVVAAQQVSPLPTTIAGVMVGGPTAPTNVSHQLPTPLLDLLGFWRSQQCLDFL